MASQGISGKDRRFQYLTEDVGAEIALYCFCAVFNVEYDDKVEYTTWEDYATQNEALRSMKAR